MKHTDVKGRTFLVVGLARSGCAAGALLRRQGARVVGVDDADEPTLHARWNAERLDDLAPVAFDEIHTGGDWSCLDAWTPDGVVLSPGVRPDHPALRRLPPDTEILGELEWASRFYSGTLVAVTGTNGKSTTTELIAHLARTAGHRAEALGNVGRPLALVADELGADSLAVVETSSFQLETIRTFRPRVGVVLNLEPDHLDRYDSVADYFAAKRRLADALSPGGTFVTWTRCAEARAWRPDCPVRLFGERSDGAEVYLADGALWIATSGDPERLCGIEDVGQRSALNLRNATAAVAALLDLVEDRAALATGLRDFRGLPHRQEVVAGLGAVRFIDDSKATNVAAALAALEDYPGRVVLIAGGSGKGEDYAPLRSAMDSVHTAILIGDEGPAIGRALDGAVSTERAATLEAAVARAAELAAAADFAPVGTDRVVMLSPACASFDMFRNYHERGAAFRAAALALGASGEDGT